MLNNGLANWVQDKSNLIQALAKHIKLIKYKETDIINVKLGLLTPEYQLKHINPGPEKYCTLFLDKMDRALYRTLSFIGLEDYRFEVRFSFQNHLFCWQCYYYFLSKKRENYLKTKRKGNRAGFKIWLF